MGFIIHVSSVSCGVPSFDAEKLQEKELRREHPRSVDDLTWLSCNVELISWPKLGLKFHLLPSSDIRPVRVGCTSSLQSGFLLHMLSLCFSRRVRHRRPDISASGRQRHLRLLHKHLQLWPRSGESPHLYFIARVSGAYVLEKKLLHLSTFETMFFLTISFEGVTHRALQSWEEKARTWTRHEKVKTWNKSVDSSLSGGIFACHECTQCFF